MFQYVFASEVLGANCFVCACGGFWLGVFFSPAGVIATTSGIIHILKKDII